MPYSQEEIQKYLEILESSIKNEPDPEIPSIKKITGNREALGGCKPPTTCCHNPRFIIWCGYRLCENCCTTSGHVLGYFDNKEYDRFHFQKKSVYQPKYYYEKKVNQISKRINLSDEEKSLLYDKLISIDKRIKEQLNNQFGRKRLINIFYLIKKILEEMGSDKSEEVYLKIGEQTLQKYDDWWENYQKVKTYGFPLKPLSLD